MVKEAAIASLIRKGTPIKFGSTADHKSRQIESVSRVQNAAHEIAGFDLRVNDIVRDTMANHWQQKAGRDLACGSNQFI
jgi:hypothetical protein